MITTILSCLIANIITIILLFFVVKKFYTKNKEEFDSIKTKLTDVIDSIESIKEKLDNLIPKFEFKWNETKKSKKIK